MSDVAPYIPAWPGLARHFNQFNGSYGRRRRHICLKCTREFMKPICKFIRNYKGPAVEMELACKWLIYTIIWEHQIFNSNYCPKRLKHNALYVAAKVAFTCGLSDSGIVANLLNEIYRCEGSFWPLFSGAFGDNRNNLFDFEESTDAIEYFLNQASKERMQFVFEGVPKRMADLKLFETNGVPSVLSMFVDNFKLFKILIRYGVRCYELPETPSVAGILKFHFDSGNEWTPTQLKYKEFFLRAHPIAAGQLPTLKELAKVAVRNILYDNHQLPRGINELEIPTDLKMYLNLEF